MAEELAAIRKRLDATDAKILDAVAERLRIVDEVAALKARSTMSLRDALREDELLTRLQERGKALGLNRFFVRRLFEEIVRHSLRVQQHQLIDLHNPERRASGEVQVAYQGTDGAYSQIAAEQHFAAWRANLQTRGYDSFAEMLTAVRSGAADYAMLPVENTTAGSINEAFDLLASMDLAVVGEELLRVEHCLVALADVPVSSIRHVYSHPQALAQCSLFLAGLHDCTVESYKDTAMSCARIRDAGDPSKAAIASERAADAHGLVVIAHNLENRSDNTTRFMVVARRPLRFDTRIECKTSLIFATRHERGALVRCLNELANHDLNLTKLESRPRPNTPWEYLFYVDFEGNVEDERVQETLEALREHTSYLKVLGSYPVQRR